MEINGKDIIPVEEPDLKEDKIYIIIDTHAKRPKIWIWSGAHSSVIDRYHAGVSATKIKSRKKLYGASIEVVESGHEPEQFPNLGEAELLQEPMEEPFEEEVPLPKPQMEVETNEQEVIEKATPTEKEPSLDSEQVVQIEAEIKGKFKMFLKAISEDLNTIAKKIDDFIQTI
jgi:hypothetical protein